MRNLIFGVQKLKVLNKNMHVFWKKGYVKHEFEKFTLHKNQHEINFKKVNNEWMENWINRNNYQSYSVIMHVKSITIMLLEDLNEDLKNFNYDYNYAYFIMKWLPDTDE